MDLPADPLPVAEIVAQQRFLRSVARQLVRDAATADDVVQEAYLRALDRGGERPRRLRAWLGRVVANLARDRRRGEARRDAREQAVAAAAGSATAPEGSPAAIAARVEMHRRLADRVLALAPAYRDVVLLHHFEGKTVAEVATRLGIPFETARTRLRRALETLRGELEVELGGRDELLAALLPLATFVVPVMPPVVPPLAPLAPTTAASTTAASSASTTAAAVATSGALIGVPLAMSTTTKVALAAVLTAVAGGVWLWNDATLGDPPPRLDAARATDGSALEAPPVFEASAPVDIAAERAAASGNAGDATRPQPGRAGLRVRTVWSDATPAARIRLRLEPLDARDGFDTLRRATSDDDGVLLLDDLDAGDVIVAAAGFATVPDDDGAGTAGGLKSVGLRSGLVHVTLVDDAIVEATVELPLRKPVHGVVVDGSRRPIAGAEIWVSDRPRAWSAGDLVATSDARGEFMLPAVDYRHFAAARADGLGWSEVVGVDSNHYREQRIELQLDRPGATVRGIVRGVDGRPIVGALLLAYDSSRGSRLSGDGRILGDPPPIATQSAADGSFRLETVPFGSIELFAEHPLLAPRSTTLDIAALEVVQDVTLDAGGTLDLHVVDERGFDVADAAVELQLFAGPMALRSLVRRGATGAAGLVAFDRLPASGAFLSVAMSGCATTRRSLRLAAGANFEELELRASLTLRGRVVDEDGRGCSGINVELVPADVRAAELPPPRTTDADGRFEFADCADVVYLATLFPTDGMSFIALRRGIELRPGDGEALVRLDAEHRATGSLRGRVVAADGKAVARPGVQFSQQGGNVVVAVPTLPDGRFEVGPLPAGTFWLIASADGFASRSCGDIALAAGEARDLGDLALELPTTLRVRARRSDGQRVKPTDLALGRGNQRWGVAFTVDGDALRTDDVSPGDCWVEVAGPGLAWKRVAARCTAGVTTDVDLDVETGFDVRYVVSRRDGAALGGSLRLTVTDASGEALTDELHPLPDALDVTTSCCLAPGEWTLEIVAPDGARAEATIAVGRGASAPTATLVLAK